MADERWLRVKTLLNAALDAPPDERQALVERACGSDAPFRREVESLLAQVNRTAGLVAEPVFDVADGLRLPPTSAPAAYTGAPVTSPDAPAAVPTPSYVWLALLLGITFAVLGGAGTWKALRYAHAITVIGWDPIRMGGAWRVLAVDSNGPAAATLLAGDEIIAINGDTRVTLADPYLYLRYLPVGSTYTLSVARQAGGQRDLVLPVVAYPRSGLPTFALYAVLSLSFGVMGLVIGLSRPQSRVTQLGCVAGFSTAFRVLAMALGDYRGAGEGAALILDELVLLSQPWHLAFGFHFLYLLAFSPRRSWGWSAVNVAIYAGCAAMNAVSVAMSVATLKGPETAIALQAAHPGFRAARYLLFQTTFPTYFQLFVFAAMCVVVLRGYRRSDDADHRRRIRWVVLGCVCGLAPLVLYMATRLLLPMVGATGLIRQVPWTAVFHVVNACLLALPASLAYAVARHRVLGISVVMRRSVQYLLAKRVLQVLLLLPVAGLFLPLIKNPNQPVTSLLRVGEAYSNLLLVLTLGLSLRYRERLRGWLDRQFFRAAYGRELLLRTTLERIKDAESFSEVGRLIGETVSTALHPSFLCVVGQEPADGSFVLSHATVSSPQLRDLAAACAVRAVALGARAPFDVAEPTAGSDALPALAVPIVNSHERLTGLLILGDKRSEEPYGTADRELLKAVADQISLVQENLWLRLQVDEDQRMRRDVLGHLPSSTVNLLLECPTCGICVDRGVDRCAHDGSELSHRLPIERLIAGRYRLDRRLGEGGMGAVYEAADVTLRRAVAVKIMLGRTFGNRLALRRFEREAQAIARLNHPNIVSLFDFGRIGSDGAYLVMERVHGLTWRASLGASGLWPVPVVAQWIDQLLAGLAAAHTAGVVHRDVKPDNVLIARGHHDADECIKLVDFGLALLDPTAHATHSLTGPESVLGTLGYMSPEQARGEDCDQRSDLFAVGVMAIEALTGHRPAAAARQDDPLHSLAAVIDPRSAAGQALQHLLRKSVAAAQSDRFQTAEDMRAGLITALRASADVGSPSRMATD